MVLLCIDFSSPFRSLYIVASAWPSAISKQRKLSLPPCSDARWAFMQEKFQNSEGRKKKCSIVVTQQQQTHSLWVEGKRSWQRWKMFFPEKKEREKRKYLWLHNIRDIFPRFPFSLSLLGYFGSGKVRDLYVGEPWWSFRGSMGGSCGTMGVIWMLRTIGRYLALKSLKASSTRTIYLDKKFKWR